MNKKRKGLSSIDLFFPHVIMVLFTVTIGLKSWEGMGSGWKRHVRPDFRVITLGQCVWMGAGKERLEIG